LQENVILRIEVTRREAGLEKSHATDALCIAGHPKVAQTENNYLQKFVRKNNRQLHKMTVGKDHYRKANKCPKEIFGFQLFDKVLFEERECFVGTRRTSGSFKIQSLDKKFVIDGKSYKKLKLLERGSGLLWELQTAN